jgi:hypothetical protein
MSAQPHANTEVCSECQRLLEASENAREVWNEHRVEICRSRLVGKEAGDQLLRLQAKYARAYAAFQKHVQNCVQARFTDCVRGTS